MSAFKQKLARLGATAGVLAASTAAIFAVGGATASSAMAAECSPGSLALAAEGSTLQKVAELEWTSEYNTVKCPGANAHFTYTGTGSGAALSAFGYTTHGGTVKTAEAFVGTDEAPPASEIKEVAEAHPEVAPVIIPIAQTSISVIANKPAKCVLTGGITWTDLNKLFNGEIKMWSEITTIANRAECEGAENGTITRVVRADGSGTTYQFKNYLAELHTQEAAAEPGKVLVGGECKTVNWDELRPNATLNLVWPEANCNTGVSSVERAEGGGGVVNFVKSHENTIGYAAYSDVFTNGATADAQSLQNAHSVLSGNTFALPGKKPTGGSTESEANCGTRTYTVPTQGREVGGTGKEVDWSEVFGAVPTIGSPNYPLCTLTFALSWHNYAGITGYTAAIGSAVKKYLGYVLNETEGQAVLNSHGYETLPHPAAEANNVLKAANFALQQVE